MSERYADEWDRLVNRGGARDSLVCYCGQEVACYHTECLALVGRERRRPPKAADDAGGSNGTS